MNTNSTIAIRVLLACVGMTACAAAASAQQPAGTQNPLGGGRALDANTRVGGDRTNQRSSDIDSLIRFNDAVISGNASGGKSFRGPLGYRAGSSFGDFSSSTGGVYRFQRDSASAGLAGTGVRSSDLLQYQFDVSSGRANPDLDPRISYALTPSRSNDAASGTTLKSMRSIAQFELAQARRESVLGVFQTADGSKAAMTASSLRGIVTSKLEDRIPAAAPVLGDGSSLAGAVPKSGETPEAPSMRPIDTSLPSARIEAKTNAFDPITDRFRAAAEARGLRALAPVTEPIANRPTPLPGSTTPGMPGTRPDAPGSAMPGTLQSEEQWQAALKKLRENLGREGLREGDSNVIDTTTRLRESLARPIRPLRPGEKPPAPTDANDPMRTSNRDRDRDRTTTIATPGSATPGVHPDAGELYLEAQVRKAMQDMTKGEVFRDYLTPKDAKNPEYVRLMAEGRNALTAQRWFDAETSFARAMLENPTGDGPARIGRLHAQLGGGLFSSAGTALQVLLSDHPELMPARFDETALLSRDKSAAVAADLQKEVARVDSALGVDASFLLAYLGYQYQDQEWIRAGLDGLDKRMSAMDPLRRDIARLAGEVWGGRPVRDVPKPSDKPAEPAKPDANK